MTQFRVFSSSQGLTPAVRNIDADAPNEMRQELVDVIFSICEADEGAHISSRRIYEISQQSMGMGIAANPYGGYRYAREEEMGDRLVFRARQGILIFLL